MNLDTMAQRMFAPPRSGQQPPSPCFPCNSISLHISAARRKVAARISTRSTVAGKKEGKKEKIFKALLPLSAFTSFPSLFLFSQPLILAAPMRSGHKF